MEQTIHTIELLTRDEKAEELGISPRTLDRWTDAGKITTVKQKNKKKKWFLSAPLLKA